MEDFRKKTTNYHVPYSYKLNIVWHKKSVWHLKYSMNLVFKLTLCLWEYESIMAVVTSGPTDLNITFGKYLCRFIL